MSIGDTYNNDNLKAGAFIKFANDMKLRREIIVEILNSTIDKVANTFTKVLDRQEDLYGKNVIYSNLADVIEKNIKFFQKLVHL